MWRTLAIVVIAPLAACSGGAASEGGGPDPVADATYDLTTRIHMASVRLPGGYDEALRALEGMQEDPAGTLLFVLEESNPAAAALLDAVPGPLKGQLKDWMNDYIFSRVLGGLPVAEQFGELAAQATAMLDMLEIASRLDPRGEGSHELRGIGFVIYGESLLVEADAVGIEEPIVTRGVEVTRDGEALAVGPHGLDVPVGPYAVFALNMALTLKFGADLEGLLAAAIDCEGLAADVSGKCMLGVCVGHETELRDACTAGATAVADYVQGRIRDLALELALQSGHARVADRDVQDGVWDAQVNMGTGDMAPEATFTGFVLE